LVAGPKFCGKPTLCGQYAKSAAYSKDTNTIELARSDPASVLLGEKPRLIDEWQKAPKFKMALVSHGSCFLTEDGVWVVSITCLKP